jgi:sugar phosphate isomerase/epimerase
MTEGLQDFSRLCVHSITTKSWTIEQIARYYPEAGIGAVSVWRFNLEGRSPAQVGEMLRRSGLEIVSLVRSGFFPASSPLQREEAIRDNLRAIDEASALGCPMLVLVCGADPGQPLETSRNQIRQGIERILPHAAQQQVKLAVEPLHPMYADTRSAINTLRQANDLVEEIGDPNLGIAADVYHLWWDPDLRREIRRCGRNGNLFAFHVCDWKVPTEDLLNDRGLMGEGCIPIRQIRQWVDGTGYSGYIEVEIFSEKWWTADPHDFVGRVKSAYLDHV